MKIKFIFMFCVVFMSRCSNKTTANTTLINIDVHYEEYTGSLDAVISSVKFSYPDSIKKNLADTSIREVILEGKNPYKRRSALLELLSENRLRNKYNLLGYFSRVDSNTNSLAQGKAAVFYVVKYKKLKNN